MNREIITQADAIRAGLKTFYIGRPCKRGHDALRERWLLR